MLKFLGGTFLMIGAVVGGGILAIPIVSTQLGFFTTLALLICVWALMTKTGLYILTLSLSCPEKYNSYYSIVGKFLGNNVRAISSILFLWLLYLSLSSYVSGCVSVIMSYLHLTHPFFESYFNTSFIYVLTFGALITCSSKIIVRSNVALVISKITLLFLVIFAAQSHHVFFQPGAFKGFSYGTVSVFLIIINAFGFQFIIPSLVSYYGRQNKTIYKKMLITSTTMVLALYIAWLFTIYSIIPMEGEHSLLSVYNSSNQLLAFNQSLVFHLHSTWIINLLSLFESVALFGSFLCVSLGVFDFLQDVFKARSRTAIGFITFTPVLFLTLLSQNMYVYAMSGAGYMAIVLEIIIPIWAIQHYRKAPELVI